MTTLVHWTKPLQMSLSSEKFMRFELVKTISNNCVFIKVKELPQCCCPMRQNRHSQHTLSWMPWLQLPTAADTLRSVHVLPKTPICRGWAMQNNTLSLWEICSLRRNKNISKISRIRLDAIRERFRERNKKCKLTLSLPREEREPGLEEAWIKTLLLFPLLRNDVKYCVLS